MNSGDWVHGSACKCENCKPQLHADLTTSTANKERAVAALLAIYRSSSSVMVNAALKNLDAADRALTAARAALK